MKIQIADNIKKYRMARGFTQSDLAILLSVSTQAVSKWENGQTFPDITALPLLAKYLDVSIDELMGTEESHSWRLKKELRDLKQAINDDQSEKAEKELRILEIYEELASTENYYLISYFQRLMSVKNEANSCIKITEDRVTKARQLLKDRLRTSNMSERVQLLSAIAAYEDEEKLEQWADEYELPEHIKTSFWDELLLSRYAKQKSVDKFNEFNQKILYKQVKNTVYFLTESVFYNMKDQEGGLCTLQRYRMALDTLNLYSNRADDIFIFVRIMLEIQYAELLLINECSEESLEMFLLASKHLSILYDLPDGCMLNGSVSLLDTVSIVISRNDKYDKCIFNIGRYEKNPQFDKIREDKRFTGFMESLNKFFPSPNCRSWMNEKGNDNLDAQWQMLLDRAGKEAASLSDGNTVVMLTSGGTVHSISFRDMNSACDAEGAMKFLLEKKKSGDSKIEKLICMWHDGGIDIPSFAFREALLAVDSKNLSTQMLLNGFEGYVVKTVKVTMMK